MDYRVKTLFRVCLAIWTCGLLFAQELLYKYDYHHVLLDHFATKSLQLNLPCKGLSTDNKRSGRIVINLYCDRQPFQVKIIAPTPVSCKASDSSEYFHIYLNARSHFLQDQEIVDLSDPLLPGVKRLNALSPLNTIDEGLQSYGQLLTTGPMALLEYTPSANSPSTCQGNEKSSKFLELEYVLVSHGSPNGVENFRFTKCPALNGLIPTGLLCDQFSDDRPLACPVSIDPDRQTLSPATGQDRRDLDCYPLVFGKKTDKILDGLLDGSIVPVKEAGANRFTLSARFFITSLIFRLVL